MDHAGFSATSPPLLPQQEALPCRGAASLRCDGVPLVELGAHRRPTVSPVQVALGAGALTAPALQCQLPWWLIKLHQYLMPNY